MNSLERREYLFSFRALTEQSYEEEKLFRLCALRLRIFRLFAASVIGKLSFLCFCAFLSGLYSKFELVQAQFSVHLDICNRKAVHPNLVLNNHMLTMYAIRRNVTFEVFFVLTSFIPNVLPRYFEAILNSCR